MDRRDAFMAEIIAHPGDDNARLRFSDWLEESGEPERAEFIRVQCELQPLRGPFGCGCSLLHHDRNCRWEPLRKRERELWVAHTREWFNVGGVDAAKLAGDSSQNNYGNVLGVVSRGFVDEVRCTLAAFYGEPCERCENGRDRNGNWILAPERITGDACYVCHGTGRTSGIGPKVAACQPVDRWTLTGVEPELSSQHSGKWRWYASDASEVVPSEIPFGLYENLFGSRPVGALQPYWESRDAAMQALSDACVKWANAEAAKVVARPATVGSSWGCTPRTP